MALNIAKGSLIFSVACLAIYGEHSTPWVVCIHDVQPDIVSFMGRHLA